jgi:putative thioredoxin
LAWCGPCKQLTPILEKTVKAAKGKVKLVKMNIDEHPAIPGQMGIQSIPAVIAFVNGQPADGFMGALPEGQVTAFLERLTKDKIGGETGFAQFGRPRWQGAPAAVKFTRCCLQDGGNVPRLPDWRCHRAGALIGG